MNTINNYADTARQLRLLAKQLEDGIDAPDFAFVTIVDGNYLSCHRAEKDVFGLLGLVEYRKNEIQKEIE